LNLTQIREAKMLIGHCLKHATAEAQWPKIDVVNSCDGHASLKRLGTDHIDLLYIHKPTLPHRYRKWSTTLPT
jgi:diketogulonate reductase-like aldo/keto reductase